MNNLLKFHNSREYADSMKPLNDKHFANRRFKTGLHHSKEFNISHSTGVYCMELSGGERVPQALKVGGVRMKEIFEN